MWNVCEPQEIFLYYFYPLQYGEKKKFLKLAVNAHLKANDQATQKSQNMPYLMFIEACHQFKLVKIGLGFCVFDKWVKLE